MAATDQAPDRVASGAGGASAGTAMIAGGLEAGSDSVIGVVLLLASPLTSVVVQALVWRVHLWVWRRDRERSIKEALRVLDEASRNEDLSPSQREHYRELRAKFVKDVVDGKVREATSLLGPPPVPPTG